MTGESQAIKKKKGSFFLVFFWGSKLIRGATLSWKECSLVRRFAAEVFLSHHLRRAECLILVCFPILIWCLILFQVGPLGVAASIRRRGGVVLE